VAAETGDVGLAQAARRLWNDATRRKMCVVGSVGSQEKYKGQVALQRGPIVYGFEALDNAGRVDVQLARDAGFTTQARPDLLGGVTTISGGAGDGRSFTAIPFYALANREPSKQAVWIAQQGQLEQPKAWPDELYRVASIQ